MSCAPSSRGPADRPSELGLAAPDALCFLPVLYHLCPGDPVCRLRDDLLLSHQLSVLRVLREDLSVHGQNPALHTG